MKNNISELKLRRAKLNKLVKAHDKKVKDFEANYKKNPKWVKAVKHQRIVREKEEVLSKKIRQSRNTHKYRFIQEGNWMPEYGVNYGGRYTNIHAQVLTAIKKNTKISLLRGSDIETLVSTLIKRAHQSDKPLIKLELEQSKLSAEKDRLYSKIWNLEKTPRELQHCEYHAELLAVKHQIDNPKTHEVWDARNVERDRVKGDTVIDAVQKTFEELEQAEAEDNGVL